MNAVGFQFKRFAVLLAVLVISGTLGSRSGEFHIMDHIEDKVQSIAQATTAIEERDRLISLRDALRSNSIGISIILHNPDGTESDLATTGSPNPKSMVQLRFAKGTDTFASQVFSPHDIGNLYILFQE